MLCDVPARKQAQRSFGKRLDAHDARQHRRTVNLMVMQERLDLRIQRNLNREAAVKSSACDLADHRSLPERAAVLQKLLERWYRARQWHPIPFSRAPRRWPITISPRVPPAVSSRRISGMPASGGQHVDARHFHHLGDGAARGHADAAPRRPVDDDAARCRTGGAEARCDLAQQIVGRAVVRLSGDCRSGPAIELNATVAPSGMSPMACSRLNQPSLLTSKTRSNSRASLSGRKMAALDAGGVQQHVDASAALAHLLDHLRHGVRIA